MVFFILDMYFYAKFVLVVTIPAEGPRGGRIDWGGDTSDRLYKSQNIRQSPSNIIQSPNRQYKAPTYNTNTQKDNTEIQNIRQNLKHMPNPNRVDKNQKYSTSGATNINLTWNIKYLITTTMINQKGISNKSVLLRAL